MTSYRETLALASSVFGGKLIGDVCVEDLATLNRHARDAGSSASTRAKHLRVVHACLSAAADRDYIVKVPKLPKGERPKPVKREAAYFTDDELPRLFAELPEGVVRVLAATAIESGARLGELLGLTWGDVDLMAGLVHIRRTRSRGETHAPKTEDSKREADLTSTGVTLLGAWWGEQGDPDDHALVFPGADPDGYIESRAPLRVLHAAMERARLPRDGRTFHSFRHTYARRALQAGASIAWLQRQLAHSSITVTVDRYGHWEREGRRREVAKIESAPAVGY